MTDELVLFPDVVSIICTRLATATGEIYLQVTVAADDVTFSDLTIFDNADSGVTPDTTHAYLLVGNYTMSGGAITSVTPLIDGSQGLTVCRTALSGGNVVPTWTLI